MMHNRIDEILWGQTFKQTTLILRTSNFWARKNCFGTLGSSIGLYLAISDSPTRLTTLLKAIFFFQKNGPLIFGSPTRLTTLIKAVFFFQKNCLQIFGSPTRLTMLLKAVFFCQINGPHIFGVFGEPWLSTGGRIWELVR